MINQVLDDRLRTVQKNFPTLISRHPYIFSAMTAITVLSVAIYAYKRAYPKPATQEPPHPPLRLLNLTPLTNRYFSTTKTPFFCSNRANEARRIENSKSQSLPPHAAALQQTMNRSEPSNPNQQSPLRGLSFTRQKPIVEKPRPNAMWTKYQEQKLIWSRQQHEPIRSSQIFDPHQQSVSGGSSPFKCPSLFEQLDRLYLRAIAPSTPQHTTSERGPSSAGAPLEMPNTESSSPPALISPRPLYAAAHQHTTSLNEPSNPLPSPTHAKPKPPVKDHPKSQRKNTSSSSAPSSAGTSRRQPFTDIRVRRKIK